MGKSPLSIRESFWHLITIGSRYHPYSSSSAHILIFSWWLFFLGLTLVYFLLLPAQLSSETRTLTSRRFSVSAVLENIETIGVVNAGSTLQMLQQSENKVHKDIWR